MVSQGSAAESAEIISECRVTTAYQLDVCTNLIQRLHPGAHILDICSHVQKLRVKAAKEGSTQINREATSLELMLLRGSADPGIVHWQRSGTPADDSVVSVEWIRSAAGLQNAMLRPLEMTIPAATFPCLAMQCNQQGVYSARFFSGLEPGAARDIRPGSRTFVRMPGEDFLRASLRVFEFGRAKGHGSLSDGQPVLFAGEMEINEQGQLTRWNNMSGTYCFPEQHAFQAGLPLVSFWGVVERPQTQDSSDWLEVSNDVWLHKVDPSDAPLPSVTKRHPQQIRLAT